MQSTKMKENGIRISIDGNGPDASLGGNPNDVYLAMKDNIWPWSKKERYNDLESIYKNIAKDHSLKGNPSYDNKHLKRRIIHIKHFQKIPKESYLLSLPPPKK